MKTISSLKSYYEKNRTSRVLANGFFLLIIFIYLMPALLAISGFDELAGKFLNFRSKTLGLDSIISIPLIIIFITSYTFYILKNKILSSIYSLILILNLGLLFFGIIMSGDSSTLKAILLTLAFFFPLILVILSTFGKTSYEEVYKVSHFSAILSIILPLLFLGLIGRLAFSFII